MLEEALKKGANLLCECLCMCRCLVHVVFLSICISADIPCLNQYLPIIMLIDDVDCLYKYMCTCMYMYTCRCNTNIPV